MTGDEIDPFLRELGRNIRAERARRGWTQETLSERSSVGVAQIRRMEHGASDSGVTKVACIALALEVDLAVLLKIAEPPLKARHGR